MAERRRQEMEGQVSREEVFTLRGNDLNDSDESGIQNDV